jgi:hypothetical protein
MKLRKQKGGNNGNTELQPPPKPELYTFPSGVGTARQAALQRQVDDSNTQANINNHIHQSGGNACMGGSIAIAPTYGVQSGPNHMNPSNQTITNSNVACQGEANRVYDSQVEMPSSNQNGGKRRIKKSRTKKSRTKKSRTKKSRTKKYKNKKSKIKKSITKNK